MIQNDHYGIFFAVLASIFWSITVTILKPISAHISPFLINPVKNSIGLFLFIILFFILDVPFWYNNLYYYEYFIILISGALGMVLGDTIFIYALNKIGANRVAIVDSFSPLVIYFYSMLLLPNQSINLVQTIGFGITIFGLLLLSYEKDFEDIDYKVKQFGILLVLLAMLCTGFGVVFLKTVLNRVYQIGFDGIKLNLWITAFRLIPGVIFSWIIFACHKNRNKLLLPLTEKRNYQPLIIASILGPFFALSFWILGYAFISKPAIASIISQSSVIFIILLASFFLNEKLTKMRIISTACVFIGVIIASLNNY